MKRAFVGLVILLAFGVFTTALFYAIMAGGESAPAFAARRVVAQVQPTPTKAVVALLYDDGSWATVTPPRSATPTPTATASPTSTATPPDDATPTIEDTRTPTDTPPPTPTPTATFTPSPTTPPPGKCWGTVTASTLNVRAEPWGAIVGQVSLDDYLTFDARWYRDFWWWRIEWWQDTGNDTYTGAYVSSNWIEVGDTANCDDLPDVTPGAVFEATHGGHAISSTGANALLEHCEKQTAVKLFEHVMHYAAAFRACNPDIFIVCRFWTDDIARETNYDAEATYAKIGAGFPSDCDAAEPENEKLPRSPDEWRAWVQWAIDFSTLMAERRNMQVLVLGMGPGWPAFDDLHYILPYLRWVNDHPLPDGRYHGVSSHASPYAPFTRADMPWLNDPYISGRVYLMRDWLYATTDDNFDLYEWNGVWFISELGLSDGYSGNWSAPYSCNEVKLAYWETQDHYTVMGFPHGFSWWNFGPPWSDDSACAGALWG